MDALRNGMWVTCDQGVGIYVVERVAASVYGGRRLVDGSYKASTNERIEREGWVHLVNEDGSTLAQLPASRCRNIEQAPVALIPAARIDHLSAEQLASRGYK